MPLEVALERKDNDNEFIFQTISLKDGESRGHWMSIAGGVAAGAASGVRAGTQKLIEKGITIGTVGTTVINMSTGANLIVNGCTVADSTYRVIAKLKDGERPSSLEVSSDDQEWNGILGRYQDKTVGYRRKNLPTSTFGRNPSSFEISLKLVILDLREFTGKRH